MNVRQGNLKINFTQIARELGISVMTVYRVVNNAPRVSHATRQRVTDALNRCGYFTHRKPPVSRVLFDFTDHPYLRRMGECLIRRLPANEFVSSRSDHRRNQTGFFNAAAESDIIVFCSVPDDALLAETRRANPDVYTITLTTESSADVTITPNNKQGGELVAHHLFELGQNHIAVFLSDSHPTRMERYKSFRGQMALLNPDCRIDEIHHRIGESFVTAVELYFSGISRLPGVIFFPAGGFAQEFWEKFTSRSPDRFRSIGIMSYDRPEDLFKTLDGIQLFDRIEFVPENILDWAEYYIINRPMMKKRSPVHTCVNSTLVVNGSVPNLKKR